MLILSTDVPEEGLEPSQDYSLSDLNAACLPISPSGLTIYNSGTDPINFQDSLKIIKKLIDRLS